MGKASLYYYFPTKESIFEHVIMQEQEELECEIRTIIAKDLSCTDKLTLYVNVRLNYFEKLVNLGTLNIYSFTGNRSIYKKLFSGFEAKELAMIYAILAEGIKKGEFKKELEKDTAKVILNILQGLRLIMLKKYKEPEPDDIMIKELRKNMNQAVKMILYGIHK
jgi:TetR/AcrR family transcriptional repressor of mexJK operon